MKVLKVLVLLLVFVLAVAAGITYVAGMSLERTAFRADFYHGLLRELDVARRVHEMLADVDLPSDAGPGDMPEELEDVMTGALRGAITVEWIESTLAVVIDDVVGYVRGDREALTAVIEVESVKNRFADGLVAGFDDLPEDVRSMLEADMPGGPDVGSIEDAVEMMLGEMDLPDDLRLAQLLEEAPPGQLAQIEDVVSRVQLYRGLFGFVPYIVLGVLLVLCLLLAGLAGGLKWFGVSAVVAGGACFAALTVAQAVFLVPMLTDIGGPDFIAVDLDLVSDVARYVIGQARMPSIIYASLGMGLLVIGVVIGRVTRKRPPAVASEETPVVEQPPAS